MIADLREIQMAAPTVDVVGVVDVVDRVVVDHADIGEVDVAEVAWPAAVPRHEYRARRQRIPTHRPAKADADIPADAAAKSADESHQRWGIHRTHRQRARYPAPAVADVSPAP
ncbi:hypothetical protein, partial [Metallibacterium scheffleri]|uniref:hypothetical protein n=1 Tax=Metallibacterium scheffleri TaxID=993689 RepID=UPI003CCFF18D